MGAVFALLVLLVYVQFRTLRSFQWSTLTQAFTIRWTQLVLATALIYGAYITRAFRWSAPNSQSAHMLKIRCSHPPCRNMFVKNGCQLESA